MSYIRCVLDYARFNPLATYLAVGLAINFAR